MNRFSYLAAITAVNAASTGVKSNQLLLETGIGLTKNIRTFKTSDVATDWPQITDATNTAAFEGKISGASGTGVVNSFTLINDEYFAIEINQALDGLAFVKDGSTTGGTDAAPIIVTGQYDSNVATDATTLIANQYHIDQTTIGVGTDKTGFIKNYLYPAFLIKCNGSADAKKTGFALQGKVSTTFYYQSFVCTNKTQTNGRDGTDANLLNHASLTELNKDASNRLVASTIQDLSLASGVLDKGTTTDPSSGDWLAAGMVDNFGKKLAGEFFTVGANTNGKTTGGAIKAAIMEVIATANCKSYASTLNFLTPHAKYVSGATKTTATYDGRAYMVPADATPGQKYYSCLKVGQADPGTAANALDVYTTVEVDVTRPTFWQYSATVTNGATAGLFASPGTANAGLPGENWGLPAITVFGSTGVTGWVPSMGTENTNAAQMAGDMTASPNTVTVAHWTGAATAGISRLSVNANAGDYLVYGFSASTAAQKIVANFWTGQAGMGRSSLPAETTTFKHLELFSFAQPGASVTVGATSTAANVAAKPVVVLRVPEAARKGDGTVKYYAGFQVTDDADNAVKFYTTSLTVTVTARRFGSVADWEKTIVQPNFTTIKALALTGTARTTAPTAAQIKSEASQWGGAVTLAIPGQVVGFKLPNQVRIEEVLTTTAASEILEDRGNFQGSTASSSSPGGRIAFMVPVDAGTTTTYYAALKVTNVAAVQYLSVSVALLSGAKSTGTNAILSDGLSTIHTGTAGGADVTVTEATIKKGVDLGKPAKWWEAPDYILTPNLELMDRAKAVIAFNANVGLEDTTTANSITTTALTALRSAHIPADGFQTGSTITATEWSTFPVIEVEMPTTQASAVDHTNVYLYRTYKMVLGGIGGTAGTTYYGAIRAKNISPEIWATKAAFDLAIPLSAKTYTAIKVDTATTATAWTAADASGNAPADSASGTGVWADNIAAAVSPASKNNQITATVENGNSFVIAIDHDLGTVTWQNAAVPAGKALERREELNCATFAAGSCGPSWSFRAPLKAVKDEKYYAAFKAVVATASNSLSAGTYWVSIAATVTAPIRHYATWSSLSSGPGKRDAVMWSFTRVHDTTTVTAAELITGGAGTSPKMDNTATATVNQGFNKQWKFVATATSATDTAAGWQETADNKFQANVAANKEACFDFSEFTGLTLETPAAVATATAYTALTGSQPAIAAQVTSDQLHNTDVGINAWCFTAPASGFGYVIVKTGSWYLPIEISTTKRERAFPTVAAFTSDAGTRWSGSVSRSYNNLPKQWADTPTGGKINTNFLIDEVAVKKASDGSDAAAAVDVGAFSVIIDGTDYKSCTEYAKDSMQDTADTPAALKRPTPWLDNYGSVHGGWSDFARVGKNTWAFSWQVPSTAAAADVYYLGLRCQAAVGTGDYSAMWKVSITDAPTFTATSADLKLAPGNQKATFTKFDDATEGKWVSNTPATSLPGIPDPRWDTVTASFEVEAGNGFSVEITKSGVTATVVAEADLNDEYGKPLNLEARSLILFGEVAGFAASSTGPPVVAASWSALTTVAADKYPAYSWQVPSDAAVGEVHYAAVRATDVSNKYVALFEVVVKATPVPAPEPEEEEESGVMGAVITTALVTAAIAAALFFFVL